MKAAFTTSQPFKIHDLKFGKKWVKELRSGRFRKGTGTLEQIQPGNSNPNSCEGSKFCCLGLATRLMVSQHRELMTPTLAYRMASNNVAWTDNADELAIAEGTFLPMRIATRIFKPLDHYDSRYFEYGNPYIHLTQAEIEKMIEVWGHVTDEDDEQTFAQYIANVMVGVQSPIDRPIMITLSGINDERFPFTLIADLIENYLLPVRTRYNKQMIRKTEVFPMKDEPFHTIVWFVDGKYQCSCGIGSYERFVDYDGAPV